MKLELHGMGESEAFSKLEWRRVHSYVGLRGIGFSFSSSNLVMAWSFLIIQDEIKKKKIYSALNRPLPSLLRLKVLIRQFQTPEIITENRLLSCIQRDNHHENLCSIPLQPSYSTLCCQLLFDNVISKHFLVIISAASNCHIWRLGVIATICLLPVYFLCVFVIISCKHQYIGS